MSKCNELRAPNNTTANYAISELHHNCFIGDLDKVKAHLKQNKHDVNLLDNVGRTPLHFAAGKNQVKVAKTLLKLGADPNHVDEKRRTPKDVAIEKNSKDVTKLLGKYSNNLFNLHI